MEISTIGCIPKYLPTDIQVDAARTAIVQNPMNRPAGESSAARGLLLPPEHLAVLTSKFWGSGGVRLTVAFLEPTPSDLAKRILAHMNAWSAYANVQFVATATDPQVRITRALEGYWSYLGTDILHIAANEATMCLQAFTMNTPESEFKRVVRHETGHTLGCPHEHMRRAIIEKLDARKTIDYFRRTQGWSASMVQSQVLTPLAEASLLNAPDADETSIMTYNLPGLITKDGKAIVGGDDIAPQDIEYIGKIYPKATVEPPPPEPPVGKGLEINCDFEKKVAHIWLPPGWKVLPKSRTGANVMACDNAYASIATELESALTPEGTPPDGAQAALGGSFALWFELVAALRSGDKARIKKALLAIITSALSDEEEGGIAFAPAAERRKINWGNLLGILTKLLPLVLGA